jgi:uncharacterized membrane protein
MVKIRAAYITENDFFIALGKAFLAGTMFGALVMFLVGWFIVGI